jgi:hypothetical protein
VRLCKENKETALCYDATTTIHGIRRRKTIIKRKNGEETADGLWCGAYMTNSTILMEKETVCI